MDRHVGEPLVVEADLAAVQRHQADHHVEAGGLAGAVRAEQADHLAALHLERYVLHHGARLVAFLQLLGSELAHDRGRIARSATQACCSRIAGGNACVQRSTRSASGVSRGLATSAAGFSGSGGPAAGLSLLLG